MHLAGSVPAERPADGAQGLTVLVVRCIRPIACRWSLARAGRRWSLMVPAANAGPSAHMVDLVPCKQISRVRSMWISCAVTDRGSARAAHAELLGDRHQGCCVRRVRIVGARNVSESQVHARRRRWPRPPSPPSSCPRRQIPPRVAPDARLRWRAIATGLRTIEWRSPQRCLRLRLMSATSGSTSTGSAATWAILQGHVLGARNVMLRHARLHAST